MKLLLHGNAPHVRTGYGVQIALLAERLVADGHDVAFSSTYGQQGGTSTWRGLTIYPCGYEVNGNDVIHTHASHFFGGDPKGGWIIPVIDVWALVNPVLSDYQVAAWTPVDHLPVPPQVVEFFHRSGAVPVAMSRFGERLLFAEGLDPAYVPLAVDTKVFKPTRTLTVNGTEVGCRELFGLPADAFVVGMVAMNKGWARDRKGFNEAFRAFGMFLRSHPDAVLFMHSEKWGGADGINLVELAGHCGIPEASMVWTDQYAYRLGLPSDMMAAAYTAMDVLLAPSHGEGFCVPLIEAQACGTPAIATDFSSQTELVGVGALVGGQPEWDPAHHANYVCPNIAEIVAALENALKVKDDPDVAAACIEFAAAYDADRIYDEHWRPFLASLEPAPPLELDREPLAEDGSNLTVIIPAMRDENLPRLLGSLAATAPNASRFVVIDDGFGCVSLPRPTHIHTGSEHTTYAEKVNLAFRAVTTEWAIVVGDDVEFHEGWVKAAVPLSDRFDVIGTNDSLPGRVRNPDVASGRHADHFFVRRSYVDEVGASLDGPGVLAPECYHHWFVDREIIGLAKARGVWSPCLESVVEHHHPGYDGREDLREADPVYMAAVEHGDDDRRLFQSRLPLIEMQRRR